MLKKCLDSSPRVPGAIPERMAIASLIRPEFVFLMKPLMNPALDSIGYVNIPW